MSEIVFAPSNVDHEPVMLSITLKIPKEDGMKSYSEELVIPKSRVMSDEPVRILIERIRERMND